MTNPSRVRVHELDRILDALERLNLNEVSEVPCSVVDRLGDFGIVVGRRSVTELIDCVFECQASFMPVFVAPQRRKRFSPRRWRKAQLEASGCMALEGAAAIRVARRPRKRFDVSEKSRERSRQRARRWHIAHRDRALAAMRARWAARVSRP